MTHSAQLARSSDSITTVPPPSRKPLSCNSQATLSSGSLSPSLQLSCSSNSWLALPCLWAWVRRAWVIYSGERNKMIRNRSGTRESIDEATGKCCILITAAGPTVLCQVSALLLCCLFVTQQFRCFLVICNTLYTACCSNSNCAHFNQDFDMFGSKT